MMPLAHRHFGSAADFPLLSHSAEGYVAHRAHLLPLDMHHDRALLLLAADGWSPAARRLPRGCSLNAAARRCPVHAPTSGLQQEAAALPGSLLLR